MALQARTYEGMRVEPRDWAEIEAFYAGLEVLPHMSALVRHMRATGLAERLFAVTSMYDLAVANYRPIEWGGRDTLFVRPEGSKVRFEYSARPVGKPEFVRTYAPDQLIPKLDQFIAWIRW